MNSDPAVLFYIGDWLKSTAEMDSDVRGWYLNLILHNYDKKSLPNDIEKLAVLAGVKFSEFNRFEHVFEHVLKQKFEQDEKGRLSNRKTDEILRARETFQNKRSDAGKMSYVMKFMAKNFTKEYKNKSLRDFTKENFDLETDLKDEHMLKHMFKQVFELYIIETEDGDRDKSLSKIDLKVENENLKIAISEFMEHRKSKKSPIKTQMQYDKWLNKLQKDSGNNPQKAVEMIDNAIAQGWTGIFPTESKDKPKDTGRRNGDDIFRDIMNGVGVQQNDKFLNE